jgi:hypothetical protein
VACAVELALTVRTSGPPFSSAASKDLCRAPEEDMSSSTPITAANSTACRERGGKTSIKNIHARQMRFAMKQGIGCALTQEW